MARGPDLPELQITAQTWERCYDACRTRGLQVTPYGALVLYSICPAGIINEFSRETWRLYQACAGYSRMQSPEQFYALSPVYVRAVEIIEGQLRKVKEWERAQND